MKIEKCNHRTKCAFTGCQNLADYSFSVKALFRRDLCFCEQCMREMYEVMAKEQIPKGTSSPFKTSKRLRRKDED